MGGERVKKRIKARSMWLFDVVFSAATATSVGGGSGSNHNSRSSSRSRSRSHSHSSSHFLARLHRLVL